jgi:hypothetical protein
MREKTLDSKSRLHALNHDTRRMEVCVVIFILQNSSTQFGDHASMQAIVKILAVKTYNQTPGFLFREPSR